MPLEWQDKRTDERGYRSACNRYSISGITIDGEEFWQAWKLVPGGAWFAPLSRPDRSEEAARAAAEADAETALV